VTGVALEVSHITKRYGDKTAVQDLSFQVERGQVFGLLGLNGAGKSTTIRIILNILQPDAGTVRWEGRPTKELMHQFGYLPEERGLYPQMKVREQLVWYGRMNGLDKSAAEQSAARWLQRFEIAEYAERPVGDLSKGNQQKVQFIMAVLHNPKMLVLDEPFSGLDPVNTTLFKEVFREIAAAGVTILFSSHRLDHVEELSDAVGIIHDSRLVLCGPVQDLLAAQPPRGLKIGGDVERIRSFLPANCPVSLQRGLLHLPIAGLEPERLLHTLIANGVQVTHFELVRPSLHDLFLEKVGKTA
jgi:ABC-2 type transport system ATP-binding protein